MANWQEVLAQFTNHIEDHFDRLKLRMVEARGRRDPIMIQPYRGYGTQRKVFLKGRVLEDEGIDPPADNDSLWENLLNMYLRFESDEIPQARVMARFMGMEKEVVANVEGFFDVTFETEKPIPTERIWQTVELELLEPREPGMPPVRAEGQIFVTHPDCQYGVISDIDDTVLQTNAADLVRMARTVFLGNARTRLPFKGVAAFYRALFHGASGQARNPLFYVSSSPWNLYDLLSDFFTLQDIPIGPILFLRDWGLTKEELLPLHHREYKVSTVRKILDLYEDLPFILIGDSSQEDPEVYAEIVDLYPSRIQAIYIRNVSRDLKRPESIRLLAERVAKAGSTLILAENTLPMAEHAIQQGWISADELPKIWVEKEADEAPPSPVEKLLGEEEEKDKEAPTVEIQGRTQEQTEDVVEGGAIETAIEEEGKEETKKPPTVVVDGDQDDEPERRKE